MVSAVPSVRWSMKQHAESKKDFEAARLGVFAIPGPLLTHLNCGIRDKWRAASLLRSVPFAAVASGNRPARQESLQAL